MSKFDANFSDIFGILSKKLGGGLTPKGKITTPAHFVFESYWVVPSTWQSFIENGEMACITSAWSSRKLSLNARSCMLLKDYLHGRMQQVKVGDTSSDWQEVKRGVPQGNNIFVNDLFLQIKTVQLNMYADHGQLYTFDTDPVSLERRISR